MHMYIYLCMYCISLHVCDYKAVYALHPCICRRVSLHVYAHTHTSFTQTLTLTISYAQGLVELSDNIQGGMSKSRTITDRPPNADGLKRPKPRQLYTSETKDVLATNSFAKSPLKAKPQESPVTETVCTDDVVLYVYR
jgi:hypothetical protein